MQKYFGEGYHVYSDKDFTIAHLAADLLKHGSILIRATWLDKVDFPKGIVNKDAIAGESKGTQSPQL